jgi:hypothetical protein
MTGRPRGAKRQRDCDDRKPGCDGGEPGASDFAASDFGVSDFGVVDFHGSWVEVQSGGELESYRGALAAAGGRQIFIALLQ